MMNLRTTLVFLFFILFISFPGLAQEEKEYVFGTFRSRQMANAQTVEMLPTKGFEFAIRHRFGVTGPDSSSYQQFIGMDLPANIRFSFAFPIFEDLFIGIGRTKNGKTLDGEIKYRWLRQTEDNRTPFSLAVYFSTAAITDKHPTVPNYAFYSDSITPFTYKDSHRYSYNTQLILARKISDKFSIQVSPVLIYKNLVDVGKENHTFTIPTCISWRSSLNTSVFVEYAYRFNNRPVNDLYPVSVGWEFGTVGHIFQIVVSSTGELNEQTAYTENSSDYLKGKVLLGFNIRRTFWFKKLQPQP